MALYKYIRETQRSDAAISIQKERLIRWRKEPVTLRVTRPTRLDRARSLGYRAKQGIILVRQRVSRGGRQRETIRKGRRPKHFGRKLMLKKSYQQVAEERANRKYRNCEVHGSYLAGKDGHHYWYEVILIDRAHPAIRTDAQLKFVSKKGHRGRVFRGLTSAARKSRGLRHRGKGAEKAR